MPLVKSKAMPADRAFAIAVQLLWNSLPCELCSITCVIVIKLILRSIFLVLHILNRDLNNTFAEYLSICFFTILHAFKVIRDCHIHSKISFIISRIYNLGMCIRSLSRKDAQKKLINYY